MLRKQEKIKQEIEAALKEAQASDDKAAAILCPFGLGEYIKHRMRAEYAVVDSVKPSPRAPYFTATAYRVSARGARLAAVSRPIEVFAWEAMT